MVEKQRTESALTRRPLRDRGLVDQRQPAADRIQAAGDRDAGWPAVLADDASAGQASAGHGSGFELDVSSSLETIHRVTRTYAVLLDKLASHELEVRELSQSLGEATQARDEALLRLSDSRRLLQEERARSAAAEQQADRSAAMVGDLERQLADLRGQTTKLMDAVDQLFPDLEEAASAERMGLRVVR